MADASQVAMLKRSVEEWNEWRDTHSDRDVMLAGADLAYLDLSGADLGTRALGARGHQITSSVDLARARLQGSRLRMTRLTGADLSYADLSQADLEMARLILTNLVEARVRRTNFSRSILARTAFTNVDLSEAFGLGDCQHRAASFLDIATLQRSPNLPVDFLRGCGLPDRLIDYLPALLSEAVRFYSCFISYSALDQHFADRLHADLQDHGVRCWFAPHDILPGKKIHEQIDEAIRIYDRLLLILSDGSMSSEWVKTEIANARQKEVEQKRQVLFPISIVPFERVREWRAFDADTGKDSAREIREYFIPDFSNWQDHDSYTSAFDKLLRGLNSQGRATPSSER